VTEVAVAANENEVPKPIVVGPDTILYASIISLGPTVTKPGTPRTLGAQPLSNDHAFGEPARFRDPVAVNVTPEVVSTPKIVTEAADFVVQLKITKRQNNDIALMSQVFWIQFFVG
jgi:hypothetical protein